MGRINACSELPPPPSNEERNLVETRFSTVSYPSDSAPCLTPVTLSLAHKGVVPQDFADYLDSTLSRWSMKRFTYDWLGQFDDRYNQVSLQFFLRTFKQALISAAYGVTLLEAVEDFDLKLTAVYYIHTQTLCGQYKAQLKNPGILTARKDAARVRKAMKDVSFLRV